MSVCYTVKFGLFSTVSLEQLMDTYKHDKQELYYHCSDEKDAYLLFAEGSIRGISVRQEKKNELCIRCNVLTSDTDTGLLHKFLNWLAAAHRARIYHEEGMRVNGVSLTYEAVKKQLAGNQSLGLLEALLSKEEYVKLPVWDADVVVYKDTYNAMKCETGYPANLYEYLEEKAFRVFQARRAKQIKTQYSVISVWAYDDALIYPSRIIAVNDPSNENEPVFIAWEYFFTCPYLKYEIIPISEENGSYYFIYEITGTAISDAFSYFNQNTVPISQL